MSSFNQDAWKLIQETLSEEARALVSAAGSLWIPQPEPCPAFFDVLKSLSAKNLEIFQSFKPFCNEIEARGLSVKGRPQSEASLVLCVPTRQKIESLGLIAQGILNLSENGLFVLSCANAQGSSSYLSKLKDVVSDLESDSGNKCKIVHFKKSQVTNLAALRQWIQDAGPTQVEGTSFDTLPGIYGWNKVDQGSQRLLSTLPALKGSGADFGAGYGYLSHGVLTSNLNTIDDLHLLEADQRALDCAAKNLSPWSGLTKFHWLDITHDEKDLSKIPMLDWIVMNPPFHEGRDQETRLGLEFIQAAAKKLKTGGRLFLVANAHLPYEDTLQKYFKTVNRVLHSEGFKVIHAER